MHLKSNINVKYIYKIYIVKIKYVHVFNNFYNLASPLVSKLDASTPLPPKVGVSIAPPLKPKAPIAPR